MPQVQADNPDNDMTGKVMSEVNQQDRNNKTILYATPGAKCLSCLGEMPVFLLMYLM